MIRAFIVYYDGKEVPTSIASEIVGILTTNGVISGKTANVSMLDSNDMSKLVMPAIKQICGGPEEAGIPQKEIEAACVFMKESYPDDINNPISFAIKVVDSLTKLKLKGVSKHALFNAISIIVNNAEDSRKYGIPNNIINVLKKINESL